MSISPNLMPNPLDGIQTANAYFRSLLIEPNESRDVHDSKQQWGSFELLYTNTAGELKRGNWNEVKNEMNVWLIVQDLLETYVQRLNAMEDQGAKKSLRAWYELIFQVGESYFR